MAGKYFCCSFCRIMFSWPEQCCKTLVESADRQGKLAKAPCRVGAAPSVGIYCQHLCVAANWRLLRATGCTFRSALSSSINLRAAAGIPLQGVRDRTSDITRSVKISKRTVSQPSKLQRNHNKSSRRKQRRGSLQEARPIRRDVRDLGHQKSPNLPGISELRHR